MEFFGCVSEVVPVVLTEKVSVSGVSRTGSLSTFVDLSSSQNSGNEFPEQPSTVDRTEDYLLIV